MFMVNSNVIKIYRGNIDINVSPDERCWRPLRHTIATHRPVNKDGPPWRWLGRLASPRRPCFVRVSQARTV